MTFNSTLKPIFLIESKETHFCPICGDSLAGYDRRLRIGKQHDASVNSYSVRRLKCQGCKRLHTELPSFLTPLKHYVTDVIESTLDATRDDCPADNSTMSRWRKSFKWMVPQLEAMLQKLWSDAKGKHYPLITSNSLLETLRRHGTGWLTNVTQSIVNANLWQPTRFAFCP